MTMPHGCARTRFLLGSSDAIVFPLERTDGSVSIPLCSFVSSVAKVLGFPITCDVARFRRSPDSMAFCLRPSARYPPPIKLLLKIKIKPQFERTVDRTVEALFLVF